MMEKINKVKEYLLMHDDDELVEVVQVINSFNGELDFLQYWDNDEEFYNSFFLDNPMELARAIYYGNFRYCDDYVRFNSYGNLETTDRYGLVKECKYYIDEIVNSLLGCWGMLPELSEELTQLLINLNMNDK